MKQSFLDTLDSIHKDFLKYTLSSNPAIVIAKMFHNPGMQFSVIYRIERYFLYESNFIFRMFGLFMYPFYFFYSYYILSFHIEPLVRIGKGLFMHNRDIVITDLTVIGRNFSIMGQTTIGTDFNAKNVKIQIGDNVSVGVGAKIIAKGPLKIAAGVTIGANAVVVKDLEIIHGVYGGIPAKFIKKRNTH